MWDIGNSEPYSDEDIDRIAAEIVKGECDVVSASRAMATFARLRADPPKTNVIDLLIAMGATQEWATEAVRIALHGHCLNRDCLRGSPAGDRITARFNHSTIRYAGCECGCSFCDYGREQAATARSQ